MGALIEPKAWNRVPITRRHAAFEEISAIFAELYPEVIEGGDEEGLVLWSLMQELRELLQISVGDDEVVD